MESASDPRGTRRNHAGATAKSSDDLLERMSAQWRSLLALGEVPPDANLFELGAHSVMVARFVARWRATGLPRLAVADVYDRPTLRALAERALALASASSASESASGTDPDPDTNPGTGRGAGAKALPPHVHANGSGLPGPLAATQAVAAALRAFQAVPAAGRPRLVFLFPDQQRLRPGAARWLYDTIPAFRAGFEACCAGAPGLGADLHRWLVESTPDDAAAAEALATASVAQPALLGLATGLQAWLGELGVRPDAMAGQGAGEIVAACCAGMLGIEATMAALVERGRAMQACPPGRLLVVDADAEVLRWLLPPEVGFVAFDTPRRTVVGGPVAAVDALEQRLAAQGVRLRPLAAPAGGQGPSLEAALPAIYAAMHTLRLQPTDTAVIAAGTATPLRPADALDAGFWARQLQTPAQLGRIVSSQIQAAARRGVAAVFVDMGPGSAMAGVVHRHLADAVTPTIALQLFPSAAAGQGEGVAGREGSVARVRPRPHAPAGSARS